MSPAYRCSGDLPRDHVDCDFTCETEDEAFDHFEATGHAVDNYETALGSAREHDPRLRGQCAEAEYR
jgi:hypothetical protein